MGILKKSYEILLRKKAPYWLEYSVFTLIKKPIRKWLTNVVAANNPFNSIRIWIYRICGFKIGKRVFIGMHCYLDDMCYDLITIGNNCTISYGVYFACHGKNQGHNPIVIEDGAYIGMRANIVSGKKDGITIGRNSIIGACTLVNKNIPAESTAIGVPCRIIEKQEE